MDFAIYENNKLKYFIEYQGEQHYNTTNNWYSGNIDKLKKQYCKNKQIPLIAIPYWHYNDITIEDLKPETSQFLV